MTMTEYKSTFLWCKEIINELKNRNQKICKNNNFGNGVYKKEKLPIKRKKKCTCKQHKYISYIYKNCCILQKYCYYKVCVCQIKNENLRNLSKYNKYLFLKNSNNAYNEKKKNQIENFNENKNLEEIKKQKKNCNISVCFNNFDNKYRRDLVITKILILTLFDPSLLKISLKFFNFLMISIINQIFEEALLLSRYNYTTINKDKQNEEETNSKFINVNINDTNKLKSNNNKKKNVDLLNNENSSKPTLHIYEFIKKFKIDKEIYFCMICMNCILFSKELFYKNTIDYFFKEVLQKSIYCCNYFKGILRKYLEQKNYYPCKCNIYYIYCIKILLIYYYLTINNILDKNYLILLSQFLKCKDPFFESLIYLIYLNYYEIGNCSNGIYIKDNIFYNGSLYKNEKNNFIDKSKEKKNEDFNINLSKGEYNYFDEKEFSQLEKNCHNNKNIYNILLMYNYNIKDLEYLYIEKFHCNIIENKIIKYYVNIESTLYPTFELKVKKNINLLENENNFIVTKRLNIVIETLITNIYNKKPTILIGNQGSGKTSIINFIYEKIYRTKNETENIISLYLDDISDSKSILGIWESNEKCFEFKYGILTKAMKNGSWIIFENINNISNSVIEKLHELTSKGYIYLSEKGEYIYPHQNFRLFSTVTVNNDYNNINNLNNKYCTSDNINNELINNNEMNELVLINHKPHNLTSLFNKWHSIFIGNYSNSEIKEILYKKLNKINDNYKNILLDCYNTIKIDLDKYNILRNINLHDLIKIINRINKRKIFIYENEKTKIHLFQICKSILISHIPNINLKYNFLIKLIKIFKLNENNVIKYMKSYSLNTYINEFNETLKNEYPKINFNFDKIYNYSFLLTSVHKSIIYEIIEGVYNKESILLIGDTGVGKTALIDYISKIFEKKLHVFVFSEQSEASDLIGNYYPFNINVKANELFEKLKRLTSKMKYICKKELNLFYLKLRIILSEKKYITFLNTCYNYVKYIMENFKKNTKLFDMKIIKQCKFFLSNCKNIINFWCNNNDNLNKNYALNYNFEQILEIKGDMEEKKNTSNSQNNVNEKIKKGDNQDDMNEEQSNKKMNELIFKFHDGILIDCIKNGYWILLDEINLAQTEILQRLQGLMDSSNKYFDVVEKGNEKIKIHENFRLFACMNPPIIPNLRKVKETNKSNDLKSVNINNSNGNNNYINLETKVGNEIDLYNSTISAGKKELPFIIRNKFTEIFVDEILEYDDVEMIVKHFLKDITCDNMLIKNITNCYLEIKKESLKNMNNLENKQISFSTRNLVRAIKYAIYVHKRTFKPLSLQVAIKNGFICNFLSCLNYDNQKIIENIFNKYFKYTQHNNVEDHSNTMHIEKNGIIDYNMLETYYQYKIYDKKKGREENAPYLNNLNDTKNTSNSKSDIDKNKEKEKYACIENSWILCGNEQINLKNILSNFIITKSVKENIKKLALCLSGIKTPILLEGNTSVGKTSLVKFFADITGHKFIRINNHMNTDINEYYGQFVNDKKSGNLIFEEGIFVKAVKNGYWLVLDELNLAPSEVLESLNRILDDNKELYIPELKCYIKAHKDFMLFATQNPANNSYIGRKELSKAFRSRFIEFHINDFKVEELEIILHRRCTISPKISKKMINAYTELKNVKSNYNYFNDNLMTLRDLIKWGNRYPNNNLEAALQGYYIIAEKLRSEKDKEIVKNILSENFLKKQEKLVIDYENDEDVKCLKNYFIEKISKINHFKKIEKSKLKKNSSIVNDNIKDFLDNKKNTKTCDLDLYDKNNNNGYNYDDLKRFQYLKNMYFGKNTCRIICLLLKCFKYKESPLLIGETGCGKTTCCELLSFVENLKLNILNCNESTDVYDIIGSLKLIKNKKADYDKLKKNCIDLYNEFSKYYEDNYVYNYLSGIIYEKIVDIKKEDFLVFNLYLQKKYNLNENIKRKLTKMERSVNNLKSVFTWFDGILVSSLKKGNIFLMDEISLVESSVIERLNSVLEYERTLLLTEKGGKNIKNLKAHDNFYFIGTMNPCGDFGKKEISHALRNRFTEIFVSNFSYDSNDFYFLIMKQINFTKEKNIKCEITKYICQIFQQVSNDKSLSSVTLSVRDSIKWITFMNAYVNNRKKLYKEKKNELKVQLNKLKSYCIRSFYHSGCLILIDGNEDMKIKEILKNILIKTLENLCLSIKYNIKKKEIIMNYFHEPYNFIFKKSYLKMNDFHIKFKKNFDCNLNKFSQNSHFVFETPNIKQNLFKIVRAMQLDNSILIEGSPGVGKTCIVNILAKLTHNKLIRINLSECTDIYDFIGSYFPIKDIKNESNKKKRKNEEEMQENKKEREDENINSESKKKFQYYWKDGKLIECMKKGYWILIDEINLANQQTLEGINSILDHRKEIFIPETNEIVKCHENFRLFCCQNPYKEGGGRKGLPKSFLNRFSKIYFEELNEEDYLCIVEKLYGNFISLDIIKKIIKLIFIIKKINVLLNESECWIWNLRDILRICKFIKHKIAYNNFLTICDMLICNRLTCNEDKNIVRSIIINVYNHNENFINNISEVTTKENLINFINNNKNNNSVYSNFINSFDYDEKYFSYENVLLNKYKKNENVSNDISLPLLKDEKILYGCLSAIKLHVPILLCGKNNSGKSSFVHKLASIFKKKLFDFSLTNDIDTFDLFGCYEQNSRNNAIIKFESQINKLNKLALKIIFKKKNLATFHSNYFSKKINNLVSSKNHEKKKHNKVSTIKKVMQIKINIMKKLNSLSVNYIKSLKNNKKNNLKKNQNNYVEFINNCNKCEPSEKINNILSGIIHLCKIINTNQINENIYVYNEGNFIKSIKNGYWILIKHLHYSTPSLLDRLNSLFEENGYILLHEFGKKKKIKPHKNFQIFLTLNSEEHYKISKALRNRCFEIYFGIKNEYVNNSLNIDNHLCSSPLYRNICETTYNDIFDMHKGSYGNFSFNNFIDYSNKNGMNLNYKKNNDHNRFINSFNDSNFCSNFLFHLINLCYNFQNKQYNEGQSTNNKKIKQDHLNLVKENNLFFYIIKNFLKNIKKKNNDNIISELINFFFNKDIKINFRKILDYINYCYNSFSANGIKCNKDIIYFCLIISLISFIIEYILDEETIKEKKRNLNKKNYNHIFRNNLNILLNYKFGNNLYYIDIFINLICTNFLLLKNNSKINLKKWKYTFLRSFGNFYCGIFSKINEKVQAFFYPFFNFLNNVLIGIIYRLKRKLENFVKNKSLMNSLIRNINKSKLVHKISSKYFIYFYFHIFINYIYNYNKIYKKRTFFNENQGDQNICIFKDKALINSFYKLKLNKIFCYLVQCFIEDFSVYDIYYRYQYLVNLKNRISIRRKTLKKDNYDKNVERYLNFITNNVIFKKMNNFNVINNYIYNIIYIERTNNNENIIKNKESNNEEDSNYVKCSKFRKFMKPLLICKKFLLNNFDLGLSKVLYFFEAFLKYNFSYIYFMRNRNNKKKKCLIFHNMNKFLIHLEKFIFNLIDNLSNTVNKDIFNYYVFIYIFAFEMISNKNYTTTYNKIIFLKDTLKFLFKISNFNKNNVILMKFLHISKLLIEKSIHSLNNYRIYDFNRNNSIYNDTDSRKYNNKLYIHCNKEKDMNYLSIYFVDKWIKNIFEIINNIYVSYFLYIKNRNSYLSILLNLPTYGDNLKVINDFNNNEDRNFNKNTESFLIQTKSFSHALKFLQSENDNSKINDIENMIIKNLIDKNEKLKINSNSFELNFSLIDDIINNSSKNYIRNDNIIHKSHQLLFYYEFIIFNINLKYLYNSYIYLLNIYMCLKYTNENSKHCIGNNATFHFTIEEVDKLNNNSHVNIKKILSEIYTYLENIDNTIFIFEEKVEILSLLKEKYGMIEYAEKNIKDENNVNNFSLNVIFIILEEILYLVYSFLMNVYMIRDENYNYAKQYVDKVNEKNYLINDRKVDELSSRYNDRIEKNCVTEFTDKKNETIFSNKISFVFNNSSLDKNVSENSLNKNNNQNIVEMINKQIENLIITYEEYTIFKNIYIHKNYKDIATYKYYSYLNSSLFNKTVIFDSIINIYKEMKKNKVTLFYLNSSNFIFKNLKKNYYDYITKLPFNKVYQVLDNNSLYMTDKNHINSINKNSLCYFFTFYIFTIFFNIMNNFENQCIDKNKYFCRFYEIYNIIVYKKEVSIEILLYLLELYKYFFNLKKEIKFNKKIQKYVFILLFLLFKAVKNNFRKWNKKNILTRYNIQNSTNDINYGEQFIISNGKFIQENDKNEMNKNNNQNIIINEMSAIDLSRNYIDNKANFDIYECVNKSTVRNHNNHIDMNENKLEYDFDYKYSYIYNYIRENNEITEENFDEILEIMFSENKILINLTNKYDGEDFIYIIGSLYISHYFLNIICTEIRKEVKEIFKRIELKNYFKSVVNSIKEEIYMGAQHNLYIEKIDLFEELSYSNFFKTKKKELLNEKIKYVKMNLPLLPKLMKNINKEKNKKVLNLMKSDQYNCNYFITHYINKNNSENIKNLYIKLKKDFKSFMKNVLSCYNIEKILFSLNDCNDFINFSLIYSCLNFIYHIRKNYNLILKFTHTITYSLCIFIHSLHNINFFILQQKEQKDLFNINKLDEKQSQKDNHNLYKYIKFPLNFNKIINLKKEQYEKISDLEYFDFMIKIVQKPKGILKEFDFSNLLNCLKILCKKIVISNEYDSISNMNELFKIEQFKNTTIKENCENIEEDYIEKNIEKEINDVFYSENYFLNTENADNNITYYSYEKNEVDNEEIELSNTEKKKENFSNSDSTKNNNDSVSDKLKEDKEKLNENLFNKIIYKIIKIFKKKDTFKNKSKNEIGRIKKNINHILDMLIKLNNMSSSQEDNSAFLLNKKNEEKKLLIFTLNIIDNFGNIIKYKDDKFLNFKRKIFELLLNNKKNHAYINKYINLLEYNFMEFFFSALNDVCFFLNNSKNEFIKIYNDSNNLNILNILNAIDNILDIPLNDVKNQIERIILKLEHLVNLINSLKKDNFANFDEINMNRLSDLMKSNILEELMIYTIYFRLYKLEEIKNIRKNINHKIIKKKTLNLFAYLFYLCYDDTYDNKNLENMNYSNNDITNDNTKIKIIKTFESLVIFLRDSMIGEFSVRLNLIFFIADIFKNSENINEKIMSNVFLNVYNYMHIYLPLIKKKIKISKSYFDLQLKKSLQKINFDLIDLEAYKATIIKFKKKIIYFTKLYFQQISITVDKFIMENKHSLFTSEIKRNMKNNNKINSSSENKNTRSVSSKTSSSNLLLDENLMNLSINENSSNYEEVKENSLKSDSSMNTKVFDNELFSHEKEKVKKISEEEHCIYNEINGLKYSFLNLRNKMKRLNLKEFLNNLDNYYSFEDLSNNYVCEIKNILKDQCINATINQKKRWIYILKHFITKKLNISVLNDLSNFTFFSNLFKDCIYFDNTANSNILLEYLSSDEIICELKNCLSYMVENNPHIDEEKKRAKINELKENLLHFEYDIKKNITSKKLYTFNFLDKINYILKNNEYKNYKILYLTIYIKSINMHEDIRNDEMLYYLFNSINFEYFNLRKEINTFYHHFVFYYLMISTLILEKKYKLNYLAVDMSIFENFLLKCNFLKSTLLQNLSIFYEYLSEDDFFKNVLFCVYKIIYIVYNSNEFIMFKYFKNIDNINCLKEFFKNISNFKLKINVKFLNYINESTKYLENNLYKIFSLNIAPYFKNKIYSHINKFIESFKAINQNISDEYNKIHMNSYQNIEENNNEGAINNFCMYNIEYANNQIFIFINNIINKKSIIYKEEYPNFQESKNVNEIYLMKDIIKLYLSVFSSASLKEKNKKNLEIFFYLSKNLFYFIKCIFLYFLDIFNGFSNISLYFLKVLKILYTKGLCRESKNENEEIKNEKENEIFHKIDFLKGIGLGEGKGVRNISDKVDNEDLDNIYNENENNFSQDENDFNEEAIESTYNFKNFCEKELNDINEANNNNKNKMENEQENLNMENNNNNGEQSKDKVNEQKEMNEKDYDEVNKRTNEENENDLEENIDDVFEKNNKSLNQSESNTLANNLKCKDTNTDNKETEEEEKEDFDLKKKNQEKEEKLEYEQKNEEIELDEEDKITEEDDNDFNKEKKIEKEKEEVKINKDSDLNMENNEQSKENNDSDLLNIEENNDKSAHLDNCMNQMNDKYNEGNENNYNDFDFNFDSNFEIESSDFSKSCSEKSFSSKEDLDEDKMEERKNDLKKEETNKSIIDEADSENNFQNVISDEDQAILDENINNSDDILEENEIKDNENNLRENKIDKNIKGFKNNQREKKGDTNNKKMEDEKKDDETTSNKEATEEKNELDKSDQAKNEIEQTTEIQNEEACELKDDIEGKNDNEEQNEDDIDENSEIENENGELYEEKDDISEVLSENRSDIEESNEIQNENESKGETEEINKIQKESKLSKIDENEKIKENKRCNYEDENETIKEDKKMEENSTENVTEKYYDAEEYEMDHLKKGYSEVEKNENNNVIYENNEVTENDNTPSCGEKNINNIHQKNTGKENNQEENNDSNTNDFSLKIDKCNIYTENFVDITNFIEKLNENLLNLNEKNSSVNEKESIENDKLKKKEKGLNKDFNISEKDENLNEKENINERNIDKDFINKNDHLSPNLNEISENDSMDKEQENSEKQKDACNSSKLNKYLKELNTNNIMYEQEEKIKENEETKNSDNYDNNDELDNFTSSTENNSLDDMRTINCKKKKNEITSEENNVREESSDSLLKEYENIGKNRKDEIENDTVNNSDYYKVHENIKVFEREYILENDYEEFQKKIKNEKLHDDNFNVEYEKLYNQINNETEMISSQLCEQLKIILEPTVRNKYEGDYKSGKKLNIKKLVNYFASDFRNSKIWKRKTKLNKRDYNILIAIDNTKSMKINNIQKMTLNAIFLVAKAFEKLNVGKIGICSFGESEVISSNNVVCSMTNSLNKQDFLKILNHFQFNHDTQNSFDNAMLNALKICNYIFKNSHTQNNSKNQINHLMLIISDGRFNKNSVKAEIFKCIQNNFIPVLMIIDTQLENNKAQSIFNLKQTFYKNNKLEIVPYLNDFPFPYFVVVNDINDIPSLTCDIIRQWFQMLNNK
ncbi:dynein-related AAA-type ATPase, putative [Plasmodium relictum]|uniref:Midasin n=1 Tax=Plasmodium relictum TaxID=85471 RepID=A0A1J1HEG8_PLARL|nr:dynein-related AAA-type ATPase, putative [Plasmodium relictum]CRH03807.1 dynein-related AAA-type ATPase, putative [Plasmodium relictum]